MESSKNGIALPEIQTIPGPRFTLHEISRFEALLRPLVVGHTSTNTNNSTATTPTSNSVNNISHNDTNANGHIKSAYITPSYPSSGTVWKGPSRSTALTRGVYGRPAAASLRSRDYILKDWNWNDGGICTCDLCRAPTSTCTACRHNAFNSYHKSVKGCDCALCQKSNPNTISNHSNRGLLIDKEKDSALLSLMFKSNTDSNNNNNNDNNNNKHATTSSLGLTAKSNNENGGSNLNSSGSKLIFQTLQSLKPESKVAAAPSLPFTPVPITSRLARLSDAPPQKALIGTKETPLLGTSATKVTTSVSSSSSAPSNSFSSTSSTSSFPASPASPSSSSLTKPFVFSSEPQSFQQTSSFAPTTTSRDKAPPPLFNFFPSDSASKNESPAPLFNFPASSVSSADIFKSPTLGESFVVKSDAAFKAPSFIPTPSSSPSSSSQASGSRQKRRKDVDGEGSLLRATPSFSFGVEPSQATPSFNFDFTAGQSAPVSTSPNTTTSLFSGSQISSFASSFDPSSFGADSASTTSWQPASFGGGFSSSAFPSLSAPPSDFGSFKSSGKAVKERKYASRKNLDAGMKLYEPENDGEFMPEDDDDGVVEVHSD